MIQVPRDPRSEISESIKLINEVFAQETEDKGLFGYKIREELFPGEDAYFKANPSTSGMASETGDIILNPYSNSDVNKEAVARNEALRLYLRDRDIEPQFEVTSKQKDFFSKTAYETDSKAMKSTIAARIYSGDPSAYATEEQKRWLKNFLRGIK